MKEKQVKYVDISQLDNHRIKTELRIEKLKHKLSKNETLINDLLSKENSRYIKKIVRISDKNQKIKNTINRLSLRLLDIQKQRLVKRSYYQIFKEWFSRIPNQYQKYIWGIIFTIPWLIGMLLFFLPSFFQSIWWSFNTVAPSSDGLKFSFVGIENYIHLFRSYVIDGNTVFSVELYLFVQNLLIDLPIILIFSILIAVFLSKPFKGHTIIKAIFFIPVIYNFTLISDTLTRGFGQYIDSSTGADQMFVQQLSSFFLEIGIGGDLISIILQAVDRIFMIVNLSGIQILIFIAAIQSIPNHLYEAAKIEGASKYVMFWKITIAMITPFILTAAVYTVIDSFTRAPIYRFLDFAMNENRYGLAASISMSYFIINIAIIGLVYLMMRKRVFYYDDKN
ncbi:carbohydrate ABC transporter permease [Acholeplasma granularum]|uniref:carbohydrate ABC transporter permease n=1 Tax=Acholeplasma granularum TaxID=264635 RepID=UPI00046FCB2A|nr:sugar ABC transporter permease [Acholeplasma granularum]